MIKIFVLVLIFREKKIKHRTKTNSGKFIEKILSVRNNYLKGTRQNWLVILIRAALTGFKKNRITTV